LEVCLTGFYNGLFALGFIAGGGACVVLFVHSGWFGFSISTVSGILMASLGAAIGGVVAKVVWKMKKSRKNEAENLYFLSIEFGISKLKEGVTYKSYCDHISQRGFGISAYYSLTTFTDFYTLMESGGKNDSHRAAKDGKIFVLKPESVFRHLEHVELKEARASSRNAMTMAAISFGLAAVVGAVQISLAIDCSAEAPNWLTQLVCTN